MEFEFILNSFGGQQFPEFGIAFRSEPHESGFPGYAGTEQLSE